MAIKILYLENAALFTKVWRKSETAPSIADEVTSVKNGKTAANNYFGFLPGVSNNTTSSASFIEGDADGAHGWRSENAYSGSFAAGNWTIAFKLKNRTAYAHAGRIYVRVYRTTQADPTVAQLTKMNSADGYSAIISFSATAGEIKTGTFTVNCNQNLTLTNEYIFIILNWLVTTPGGNVNAGVLCVVNEGAAEKYDTTEWTGAAPPQTISNAGAIATAETFGSPTVINMLQIVSNAGAIATLEAFGTSKLNLKLLPSSIASLEAFGAPKVNLKITPSGVAMAEAFGSAKLVLYLLPSGISSLESFGNATVSTGAQFLQPSSITSEEAFGTSKLNLKLIPSGIASLEAFGTSKVNLNLAPAGITTAEAFGSPKFVLYLSPSGIVSQEVFGSQKVSLVLVTSGIATEEGFGSSKLILFLLPSGIQSLEAFGNPTVIGAQNISNAGNIASTEAFGTSSVNLTLLPGGIGSAEAFGAPQLNQAIIAASVPSAEAFGSPQLNLLILPIEISSGETFGTPMVVFIQILKPAGIGTGEAFGSPTVVMFLILSPSGIESGEAIGTPAVSILYVDSLPQKIAEAKKKMFGNQQPSGDKTVLLVSGDANIEPSNSRVVVRRR